MNSQAQTILASFDMLSEKARYEVAIEILRRTKNMNFPPLTDDDLVANAEIVFLEVDQKGLNY